MKNLKQMVASDLQLREDLIEKIDSEKALLNLVTLYVQELIDRDFEKLLLVLYRLDVGEKKVKSVIDAGGPENASEAIAILILEREKEKVASREKYKSSEDSNDWIF